MVPGENVTPQEDKLYREPDIRKSVADIIKPLVINAMSHAGVVNKSF